MPRNIHVNPSAPDASDLNPGTEALPLKTLQAATRIAEAGSTVKVHPGVYRETLVPLRGEGEYALSSCRAVQPLHDTDCNGATVGSVMGVILGHKALPEPWMAPVKDASRSGIKGFEVPDYQTLARITLQSL